MRVLTAGYSHIGSYSGIIEGLPSGIEIDQDFIDSQLFLRRRGEGRSQRMSIETDKIEFLSGLIDGKTTGAPLSYKINTLNRERVSFTQVRPAHADYPAAVKYSLLDLSIAAERASARETVNTVAVGSICKLALKKLGVSVTGSVLSVCGESNTEKIKELIAKAKQQGETLGGKAKVVISGLFAGLGGFSQYDCKLDGKLAASMMSLPSVKAVEIGLGTGFATIKGSDALDYITEKGRKTNYSGGIDAGMTNGQDIEITLTIKPVPTLGKSYSTIDIASKKKVPSRLLRADTCIVENLALIASCAAAICIFKEILLSLGGDTMDEVHQRFFQKKSKDFLLDPTHQTSLK